jgi:hypothetical protein
MRSDNNLRLSMLMNTRSQRKENSTINSVFMSKEISTLSQPYQVEDTLIWSITEIWLSRLPMEERLRFGTSTNNPRPLELD